MGISTIKKFTSGRGWGMIPGARAITHLICLVTLIINIYGLGVGISTIKKFTSGRGWGMTPRRLSYKAFNLPIHPDHKYIWFRGWGSQPLKSSLHVGGGVWPWGLSYNAFNLPSHPDHKYIWFRVGISVTFFKTDFPVGWGWAPGIKRLNAQLHIGISTHTKY